MFEQGSLYLLSFDEALQIEEIVASDERKRN